MRPIAVALILVCQLARADVPKKLWTDGRAGPAPNAPVTMQAFARLARAIGPAVVNITTLQKGGELRRTRGQGTGFVIERSGYVLTNNHVVENSEEIKVRLVDNPEEMPARVVGRDEATDIALVKIDPPLPLAVAPLGDSDKVQIGEWVVAIGSPFGLDHSVTAGIVSAKGRHDVRPGGSSAGYYDFIQTDASINAGNSGGPLINVRGEVIGINTAMNPNAQGIAFAVPINMAKAILPLLASHGYVPRSWLGVQHQTVTPGLKRAFGLDATLGTIVSEVTGGGPAEQAGIVPGDVIIEFDGRPIRRAEDLHWLSAIAGAGRKVPIAVVHRGELRKVVATLARNPDEAPPPPAPPPIAHVSPYGMTVSEITVGIARELKQPDLHGVVVTSVEPESPASEAGVERGDVLLRVGDLPVEKLEDYAKAVRAIPKGDMVKLLARRDNHNVWLAFQKR